MEPPQASSPVILFSTKFDFETVAFEPEMNNAPPSLVYAIHLVKFELSIVAKSPAM